MSKSKEYSGAHRLLHWLIAFSMLFMLLTIFLRLNWMNKYVMSDILTEQLTKIGVAITEKQSVKIAKVIRGNMFEWHIYVGYLLIGLYSLRLALNAKMHGLKFSNLTSSSIPAKEKFQSWVYTIFYVCVGGSLITGTCIVNDIGPHKLLEDIHKLSLYYLVTFVVLHFAGIVIGEFTDKPNSVSEMIHGKQED
ncbi:cytochrome b/b6 domain-containing protein [Flammeovirga kamogawensis]|uniref:Cytochrome b/b6 domain-containing protein n=1 Tax=Flammeovirga kamogawensis TaxID=373891 RepID=A0ABX8GUZ6_9BACT|nr:cytochrome b/b6 domain-containing protein [Flammeovirga kamogawensis]MBB6459766.1 cytochrome b561 [Flammeovirga kamogawensis]QWG07176.1 cytochrome b/b6 domain-containing protein [Flammeovirga kamogawensis]TRX68997.1 cytochrome b/b6 domain-containing protein [Flammeovirga kamogawensis]